MLPPIIRSLLKKSAYPERPSRVELVQTHISYIFITPEFVYKVKKPVDFGFLDFTTLARRLYFSREEVRLNRRLAPDIYLGVVPVVKTKRGFFAGGKGRALEYAVKMKRIQEDAMLDRLLTENRATVETMQRVAEVIAGFHKRAQTGKRISRFGSAELIGKNIEENFSQTASFIRTTISAERYGRIKKYSEGFLRSRAELFKKRIGEGRIRDTHGDIHAEHIAVTNGVVVFDCIEFNRRFRYSDVIADMAFLSMDLEFRGRGDLARVYEEAYFRYSKDGAGRALLNFYKCYRAYVRGKVEGFRLEEKEETAADKRMAGLRSRLYFKLAELYSTGGFRPTLLIVGGLTGTGKTAVAKAVSAITGMKVISSDAVRKELFSVPLTERRREPFRKGIYSDEATEITYSTMTGSAREFLLRGRSVILDATFLKRTHLEAAKEAAKKTNALFYAIECVASEETARKRLLGRLKEKTAISDATWRIYKKQRESYTAIEGAARVSTEKGAESAAEEIIKKTLAEDAPLFL